MGEEQPEVEVIAEFDKCPWCGSTDRMMDRLGKELKEQGLITKGMTVGLAEVGGTIVDPKLESKMLTTSHRPGMFALRDICIGCGRDITIKIEKKLVRIDMVPPPGTVRG